MLALLLFRSSEQHPGELIHVCDAKPWQGLFDEVNGQLQRECGRIERLQGAVTQCARQAKELESLQNMLEESHRMLAQLRETLDKERAERLRVAGLLEHEQQRTQLLLDVLKHFK
ncbi:unnamed protein product, partial [Effrenium voratum]